MVVRGHCRMSSLTKGKGLRKRYRALRLAACAAACSALSAAVLAFAAATQAALPGGSVMLALERIAAQIMLLPAPALR